MMILDRERPTTNFALHIKTLRGESLGYVPATISQLDIFKVRDPAGLDEQPTFLRTPRLGFVEGIYPAYYSGDPPNYGCQARQINLKACLCIKIDSFQSHGPIL